MKTMRMNPKLLEYALAKFAEFKSHKKIKNYRYIIIVDYSIHSSRKRLFVYDRKVKIIIRSHHVAHGINSSAFREPGKAVKFSNKNMSKCSSIGAVATGGVYIGRFGRSVNLHGLEPGINNNMFKRRIVMHHSKYVNDDFIDRHGYIGRSWGCLAVDKAIWHKKSRQGGPLIDLVKNGVFCYLSDGNIKELPKPIEKPKRKPKPIYEADTVKENILVLIFRLLSKFFSLFKR